MSLVNILGQSFGRLVVIAREPNSVREKAKWLCQCACGNQTVARGDHLRTGRTSSCGCLNSEMTTARKTKHGLYGTSEHSIWNSMIQRCVNSRVKSWPRYGGRGIRVCDRWLNNFAAFYADTAPKPSPEHTLDRIDNDGNYQPGNCRWALDAEQRVNRSDNRLLTFRGEVATLSEWAARVGLKQTTLGRRLKKGWSVERALTEPVALQGRNAA